MSIQNNLKHILHAISLAAEKAGRNPNSVKLIAVSKTKPIELIQEAIAAGQIDLGENKVQELREKQPLIPHANWHMIGHLQRNKVKFIAPFVHLIHSVESERLLTEINKQAVKNERVIDCLLQLNISEEDAKSGLNEQRTENLLNRMEEWPNIQIKGLMGMAAFTSDMDIVRAQFRRLRLAFEQFQAISHERIQMQELSMGMSGDFEIAIEEGATMVRIGSAVFGSRR